MADEPIASNSASSSVVKEKEDDSNGVKDESTPATPSRNHRRATLRGAGGEHIAAGSAELLYPADMTPTDAIVEPGKRHSLSTVFLALL
jgi:hypothetical protein